MQKGIYKHYKGQNYKVIGVSRHTETLEEMVVYESLYGNHDLWVRPLNMFQEKIIHKGVEIPRFTCIQTDEK